MRISDCSSDVCSSDLPPIVSPLQSKAPGAPIIRDDKQGQTDNTCYRWEVGDAAATERAFAEADVASSLTPHYTRSHPSPIECCRSEERRIGTECVSPCRSLWSQDP